MRAPTGGAGDSGAYVEPVKPQFRFAFTATIQVKHWNGYGDQWKTHETSKTSEVTVVATDLAAAEAKARPLLYELASDYRWSLKAHTIEEVPA